MDFVRFSSLWTDMIKVLMNVYLDVAASVRPGNAGAEGGAASPHVERLAGAPSRPLYGVVPALRVGVLPAAVGVALAQVPAALFLPVGIANSEFERGCARFQPALPKLMLLPWH